jgi:hypothetical protein
MCKLESTKWIVIKSNKKISKNLALKIGKIRNASTVENRIYFWNLKPELKNDVLDLLKSYKYQKFEICEFYDKQFGLTLNFWNGSNEQNFNDLVKKLPLSEKFYWNNENSNLKTVTPITKKQFENIIYIN